MSFPVVLASIRRSPERPDYPFDVVLLQAHPQQEHLAVLGPTMVHERRHTFFLWVEDAFLQLVASPDIRGEIVVRSTQEVDEIVYDFADEESRTVFLLCQGHRLKVAFAL